MAFSKIQSILNWWHNEIDKQFQNADKINSKGNFLNSKSYFNIST